MGAVTEKLELLITSTGAAAKDGIRAVGDESEKSSQKVVLVRSALQRLGVEGKLTGDLLKTGLQVGAVSGLVAIGAVALDGVEKFSNLTAEVRGFQRVLGGSAEDASRVAAAVRMVGMDAQAAQSGFGMLARKIGEGKDTLSQWGVEVARNKDGNVNMAETIANIGDRYKELQDPAQRAAFLFEEFGKSGQKMAPLLSKSREELEGFYAAAAKHHEIFSQDDLDKGRKYQLTMRESKEALEGFAVAVGGSVIPIITTFTDLLTSALDILDEMSQAIGGFNLSAVAMGALIGTVIAPGLGTLIGAGAGVVAALAGTEDSAQKNATAFEKMRTQMEALDAAKAASQFQTMSLQLSAVAKWSGNSVDGMKTVMDVFRKIADESPGLGQKIIEGLKLQGVDTTAFQAALDQITAKHRDQKNAIDATRGATDQLTASTQQEKAAIEELQNQMLGLAGAQINYVQDLRNVDTAQGNYNKTVDEYGPNSAEAQAAALQLQQANQALAGATLDLDAKTRAFNDTTGKTPAQMNAELETMRESIRLHPEAAAAIQPMIDQLLALKNRVEAVPPQHDTTMNVNTGGAHAALDDLEGRLGALAGRVFSTTMRLVAETVSSP